MPSYCTVSECEEPTREGRVRCEFHEKRHQRGQSLTAPKVERLTPKQRVLEAAISLADAETDAEYEKAERAMLKAARDAGPRLHGELVRQGMAEARRRGVRLGRPREVTPEQAREAVRRCGSIVAAARALGRNRDTISDALRRAEECSISPQQVAA